MFRHPALVMLLLATCVACATSPTGRRQLIFMSDSQLSEMGTAAFRETEKKTPVSRDAQVNRYVSCVANAITAETGGAWEVRVFEDKDANAFALPGGKIGVYSGLLDVAKNQHQLAAVIGHEVAHVQAQHANERVSTAFAADLGLNIVDAIYGGTRSGQHAMALLGLGTQVGVLLPFSRTQESEADILGLNLMARAGFDPRESVTLWRNMDAAAKGGPPEFLSTHPSHDTRIDDLTKHMGKAEEIYSAARISGKKPNCR